MGDYEPLPNLDRFLDKAEANRRICRESMTGWNSAFREIALAHSAIITPGVIKGNGHDCLIRSRCRRIRQIPSRLPLHTSSLREARPATRGLFGGQLFHQHVIERRKYGFQVGSCVRCDSGVQESYVILVASDKCA